MLSIEALQTPVENKGRILALKLKEMELAVRVHVPENPERELTNKDLQFGPQLVVVNLNEEHLEALESEANKAVSDPQVEFSNVKKAMRVFEEQVSTDGFLMHSTAEDCKSMQDQLATTSEKLQIEEKALPAEFDQQKLESSRVQMADVTVQTQLKSNLQNYINTILGRFMQRLRLTT